MENEPKVFYSNITKGDCTANNHLYDLLKIEPATPVLQSSKSFDISQWECTPKCDKRYIPRNVSKLKVKTVKDIRTVFEKDVYNYLADDIEKKRHFLLRKIQDGFSTEEKTKITAYKLLNGDDPLSKSVWQMLINVNPAGHKHPKQYVLWNGKYIEVNGSRGGKTKCICSYDLNIKTKLKNTSANFKKNFIKSRVALLRKSLNVKFKPGPLGKKKLLDDSHLKYQMGHIELVKLPKPALEISSVYGTALEPAITSFLNDLRGETGVISQKLANFAVTALGTIKNQTPIQVDKACSISFDLHYKCDQNRLIMRKNVVETTSLCDVSNDSISSVNIEKVRPYTVPSENVMCHSNEKIEIKKMLDEMLQSVDININQDSMYSANDDDIRYIMEDVTTDVIVHIKDKNKRKYLELDKLDVTIIKLPERSVKDYSKPCGKSFCTLGCVCESLDCLLNLKQHCGVADCMFGCKCEASTYKDIMSERDCSDIVPGLLNLENEINSHLAKEEQKFHQTVVFSGEKGIVLKSQKRVLKSSKKYAEYYSDINLKNDVEIKKVLTVNAIKLNCKNIEPFCMVHNLYKCFCHGKFTESYMSNVTETSSNALNIDQANVDNEIKVNKNWESLLDHTHLKVHYQSARNSYPPSATLSSSARTNVFKGRNHTEDYYKNTHEKILELEKNDNTLKKKMLKLMNGIESADSFDVSNLSNESSSSKDVSIKSVNKDKGLVLARKSLPAPGKINLKKWLEDSYKNYKIRLAKGNKITLRTPKTGETVLYSWEFILSRYKNRNNFFFVSKQKPYRTFLAVNDKHPRFANCINIDDLYISDLPKYPPSIYNLLTNTCHSEKTFCLLRGWDDCWEVVASAVNILENNSENQPESSIYDTEDDLSTDKNDDWTNQKTSADQETNKDNLALYNNNKNIMSWLDVVDQKTRSEKSINPCSSWQYENIDSQSQVEEQNTHSKISENTKSLEYDNVVSEGKVGDHETQSEISNTITSLQCEIVHSKNEVEQDVKQKARSARSKNTNRTPWQNKNVDSESELVEHNTHSDISQNTKSLQYENVNSECEVLEQNNLEKSKNTKSLQSKSVDSESEIMEQDTHSERSKWFVMTVENDFTEIQFYIRGFYVTFDSIQRSLRVARISGKTVRLSLQTREEKNQQFGIYAIPSNSKDCVFIGPYEMDEPLGMEIIKTYKDTLSDLNQNQTRGVWIKTNKVDDLKVLERPLLFMPSLSAPAETIVKVDRSTKCSVKTSLPKIDLKEKQKTEVPKQKCRAVTTNMVKPIKIRRTNGFYHLTNNTTSTLLINNAITINPNSPVFIKRSNMESLLKGDTSKGSEANTSINYKPVAEIAPQLLNKKNCSASTVVPDIRPIAEIAPQIKITSVYSQRVLQSEPASSKRGSMLILKPEEINKRILTPKPADGDVSMTMDIESFLESSEVCPAPAEPDTVYEISDGEDDEPEVKNVWIQCSNIKNFGCMRGKLQNNLLSFEFPGFKYSEFYPQEKAFEKINQAIARKMFKPDNTTIEWTVSENRTQAIFLTPALIRNKRYLLNKLFCMQRRRIRTVKNISKQQLTNEETASSSTSTDDNSNAGNSNKVCVSTIEDLEETSKALEKETDSLWNEAISKRDKLKSFLEVLGSLNLDVD